MRQIRTEAEGQEGWPTPSESTQAASSYIMEFDPEEITGRFVRADESRSDGGNGLGLAIAKGYTEACNGKFDIVIDGDLFKAVMTFKLSE